VRIDPKRTYLFQDAIRCAAAQFGVETNHPEFVGLGDHGDFDAAGCGWMWPITPTIRARSAMHSNEPRSGFDLTMSKADAADSDSTVRKHRQRGLIPWKPGQSGNPRGRPPGSRNKLTEDFFRDLCDAWQAFGKPALTTAAFLHPLEFVRVVAGLMPKEMQATVTTVHLERMSDDQLLEVIRQSGLDPAATDEDAQIIQ
jgi:Family of unknown function (DUF5681)